jgi:guanine deaminase
MKEMHIKNNHEKFLQRAIELAEENVKSGMGGPFGAIVVKDGKIIGEGVNRVTNENDPTAHAEVMAIRQACKKLNTFQLTDCQIYSSCEPCPMCLGAIYWARPDALYFAAGKEDAANAGFDDSFIYKEIDLPYQNRKIYTVQILSAQAIQVFKNWIISENKKEY